MIKEVVRITKDVRINIPKEMAQIMKVEAECFVILELDEGTKTLTAYKAKVVRDIG